jgi:hypothetical protein
VGHAVLEVQRVTDRIDSLTRINNELQQREMPTMSTSLGNIDAHMQYVQTKQLQDALHAEQIRLATANRSGRMPKIVSNIRTSLGTMLIMFGERLQKEHARQAAREAERIHSTRTA